jgi:hypothetical protein
MKSPYFLLTLLGGIVLGGLLVYLARPCATTAAGSRLVDGRYLVVETDTGHWIYDMSGEQPKAALSEITPEGLSAIWKLQGDYLPASLSVGGEQLLSVPSTRYSTETRSFQVLHKFYRLQDQKLVEVPMESVPAPSANAAAGPR